MGLNDEKLAVQGVLNRDFSNLWNESKPHILAGKSALRSLSL
jgi:hypothetical protein